MSYLAIQIYLEMIFHAQHSFLKDFIHFTCAPSRVSFTIIAYRMIFMVCLKCHSLAFTMVYHRDSPEGSIEVK